MHIKCPNEYVKLWMHLAKQYTLLLLLSSGLHSDLKKLNRISQGNMAC